MFRFSINAVNSSDIDILSLAGDCLTPVTVDVSPVSVSEDERLIIKATKIEGRPPILNNVEIYEIEPSFKPSPSSLSHTARQEVGTPLTRSPPTVLLRVAFSKFTTPQGWERFKRERVQPQYGLVSAALDGTKSEPYRSFIKNYDGFSYSQPMPPDKYDVSLGFLEFGRVCTKGKRIFEIVVNGISTGSINVFNSVGCNKQLDITVRGVVVSSDGILLIEAVRSKGFAPFLANFVVYSFDSNPPPTPSPLPSPSIAVADVDIKVNAGTTDEENPPENTNRKFYGGSFTLADDVQVNRYYFKSARFGMDFSYSFDLPPGMYDVTLGFMESHEPFCSAPGKRVFNVYINEHLQFSGFDIFKTAGCHHAMEYSSTGHSVDSINTKPLVIHFKAVANNALVNFIRIKASQDQCVPESLSGELKSDHAAHAVPGNYPPLSGDDAPTSYVDSDGDGMYTVTLDAKGSHTHYFDSANNIIGRITQYTWSLVETGAVISREEKFAYNFPLGTTRVSLAVRDNACTSDEAETTVTVTGKIQPGQYCYYYSGLLSLPQGGKLSSEPWPSFAAVATSASLGFPSFMFDSEKFAARCHFFLNSESESSESKISIETGGSGAARLYKGEDLVLDTETSEFTTTELGKGLNFFEMVYYRNDQISTTPEITIKVNGEIPDDSMISHDRNTVLPILSGVDPQDGKITGGTRVKVSGYGLFHPLEITIDSKKIEVLDSGATSTKFFIVSPPSQEEKIVDIVAKSGSGLVSNPVKFAYGSKCDAVDFEEAEIVKAVRNEVGEEEESPVDFLNLPTCAALGHDGKLYVGTLRGTVQVLGYNSETLIATSHCSSEPLVDNAFLKDGVPAVRDILGITFDPKEETMMPYVATSTLYWLERGTIDLSNKGAWRNGAVDRLITVPNVQDSIGNPGTCLVYDKRIVSNLPVSNHDHSVNGMLFTQNGDLLITVGGFTNSGLPGYKLGGVWETQLSAAILIAYLSKPDFDGDIKYDNEDVLRHAKIKSGDVSIFSTGLRNSYSLAMRRDGSIYTSDQGPNCLFGDTASTCNDYVEEVAATWDPVAPQNWEGKVRHGWKNCPFGPGRKDKIIHVTNGSYYGHPNLQRGGDECIWVDPYNDKTSSGGDPPPSYKPSVATMPVSAVTGVGEYGANHFCGALRGELLLSAYKGGTTWRMSVEGNNKISGPDELAPRGGLSFVENAHGQLIFPRLTKKIVFVLDPKISGNSTVFLYGAVPFRHGVNGGTRLTLGGSNFGTMPAVWVGSNRCDVIDKTHREIVCTVPKGSPGELMDVRVVPVEGGESVLKEAVLYMNL